MTGHRIRTGQQAAMEREHALARRELGPEVLEDIRRRVPVRTTVKRLQISVAQYYRIKSELFAWTGDERAKIAETRARLEREHWALIEAHREAAMLGDWDAHAAVVDNLSAIAKLNPPDPNGPASGADNPHAVLMVALGLGAPAPAPALEAKGESVDADAGKDDDVK